MDNKENPKEKKNLDKALGKFLNKEIELGKEEKKIKKSDSEIVEQVDKKLITEDGRELLL